MPVSVCVLYYRLYMLNDLYVVVFVCIYGHFTITQHSLAPWYRAQLSIQLIRLCSFSLVRIRRSSLRSPNFSTQNKKQHTTKSKISQLLLWKANNELLGAYTFQLVNGREHGLRSVCMDVRKLFWTSINTIITLFVVQICYCLGF